MSSIYYYIGCLDGGIGRHERLKISSSFEGAGSTPVRGTNGAIAQLNRATAF